MARQIVTNIYCDVCLATSDADSPTYTEATESPQITIGTRKPRVIALCDPHRKEFYDEFERVLSELGQPVGAVLGNATTATRTPGVAGDFPCPDPECEKHRDPCRTASALHSHAKNIHGKTLNDLRIAVGAEPVYPGGKPADEGPSIKRTECDICGQVYEWPENGRPAQALGVHKNRKHGIRAAKNKTAKK